MKINQFSKVENVFLQQSGIDQQSTKMPYITVENFPKLGMLTSLRFLEWVAQNPNGVISLPTGKTPEYFIKYTHFFLDNWDTKKGQDILNAYGLSGIQKPTLNGLQFVQMDELKLLNSVEDELVHCCVDANFCDDVMMHCFVVAVQQLFPFFVVSQLILVVVDFVILMHVISFVVVQMILNVVDYIVL